MNSKTIRKAIGAVKDHTSIRIAIVAGNLAPDLEVLVVKATSHDDDHANEKYLLEIISLTSSSRGYVEACVATVSKRLSKTRDWIVALKALMLIHRLLVDGHPLFEEEFVFGPRRGIGVLNMADFRDDAHPNSWDYTEFVRSYAAYLDQKVESLVFDRLVGGKSSERRSDEDGDDGFRRSRGYRERDDFDNGMRGKRRSYGDASDDSFQREQRNEVTPTWEVKPEGILGKLNQLLRILDRFLACRPRGLSKNTWLVHVALYQIVKESFGLYLDICKVLEVLSNRFTEMEYAECVKGFNMYVNAAKMIDELAGFYAWCMDMGIARSLEYPEVKRVTDKLLGTLEGFLKGMADRQHKSPETSREKQSPLKEEPEENMNEIKALPPPEYYSPPPPPEPEPEREPEPELQPKPLPLQVTKDLVNLREDGVSADEQGNKMALALFSGAPTANANGEWETFLPNGESAVTSAWQTPAAESGKADWELALVESASNLSKQKAALAGGFDSLILNGMYDQGAVRQHVSTTELSGGSASSVALPGKNAKPTLALPAPDGTFQPVRNQDPFAASLSIPPPSYVQISDMEKKQHLLVQEQHIWQQYGHNGVQGQLGLHKISGASGYYGPVSQSTMMANGIPHVSGIGQPGGYYYPQ